MWYITIDSRDVRPNLPSAAGSSSSILCAINLLVDMGFTGGSETLTLQNIYIFARLQRLVAAATHTILLMPDLNTRSSSPSRYYLAVPYSSLFSLVSSILDIALFICAAVELHLALLVSSVGILLYPLAKREESINTVLNTVPSVFTGLEVQKRNTVA